MSLPSTWIDRIFERLMLVYGTHFSSRYAGLDSTDVKAQWASELSGFDDKPTAIAWALTHLPVDQPPNVLQFRDLCRSALRDEFRPAALFGPQTSIPDFARGLASRIAEASTAALAGRTPAEYCVARIRELAKRNGGVLSEAQRHVVECCNRVNHCGNESQLTSGFTPIPQHLLPPGLRGEK
jgi:hypothetical protein